MIVLIIGYDGVVLRKTQLWYHSIITSFVHVARYFMCKMPKCGGSNGVAN